MVFDGTETKKFTDEEFFEYFIRETNNNIDNARFDIGEVHIKVQKDDGEAPDYEFLFGELQSDLEEARRELEEANRLDKEQHENTDVDTEEVVSENQGEGDSENHHDYNGGTPDCDPTNPDSECYVPIEDETKCQKPVVMNRALATRAFGGIANLPDS